MRVLSNGKRITYKTWLFARQSLNIVNCWFCSNRIPLYFPLCVCLCTGVTSQLFSIIWWFGAWKPYIFWKHFIQADHSDHLTTWPPGPPWLAWSPGPIWTTWPSDQTGLNALRPTKKFKSQSLFLRVLGIQTSWILLNMVNHSLVSHFQKELEP